MKGEDIYQLIFTPKSKINMKSIMIDWWMIISTSQPGKIQIASMESIVHV